MIKEDLRARAKELAAFHEMFGPVLVIYESGFTKNGTHSVGVARQHNGRLGKVDPPTADQVGVFLTYATPAGRALLDHRLYLPKEWVNDPKRREETRIPDDVAFRTKPRLAGDLIQAARANNLPHDWIIADELYGRNGALLGRLEAMNERYVMEVPVNTTVWTQDPSKAIPSYGGRGQPPSRSRRDSVRSVRQVADSLPPSAWQTLRLRHGAKGPSMTFEFAARQRVCPCASGRSATVNPARPVGS